MLSSLFKEHQAQQAANKVVQEQKKKEAVEAANQLTQALVDHLNIGVAQAYLNQRKLDAESKILQQGAHNFAKQTQQWSNLFDNFNSALKELGDVENCATVINKNMMDINRILENVYKEEDAPASSSSQINVANQSLEQ